MKKNNLFTIIILLIVFILIINTDNSYSQNDPSSLKLNFAVGAKKLIKNKYTIVPIDENTSLKENDGIRLFFQPAESCFVYILLYDSNKIMTVLFPEDINNYNNNAVSKGVKYFLPDPSHEYPLDNNPGTETIYFIASKKRILEMEKIITKLYKIDDKDLNATKETSNELRDNIRSMVSGQLAQTYNLQERNPIQIAGVIRATKNDIEKYAKGLIGKDLIIKTIRIKHESK